MVFLSTLSLRRATISCAWSASKLGDFYPRSPCGERPRVVTAFRGGVDNFYPRSPCGERLPPRKDFSCLPIISIHALLAESDVNGVGLLGSFGNFYPRSPCGERLFILRRITITVDISIHALLAESDEGTLECLRAFRISIHALLAESDRKLPIRLPTALHFYPRSPCGERLKL